MKFDKRWIIGGVLLVGGGLFWMRRANAATATPTVGSVMPGPVSSGAAPSSGLNALANALFASASPAPAPTYTMTSAPVPAPAPVTQAASVAAPAPAPAPIQSWGATEWQSYVSNSGWDPSGGGG